jgi:hypothetical protein
MKNQSFITMAFSQGCLKRVPSYDSEQWFTLGKLGDFMGGIPKGSRLQAQCFFTAERGRNIATRSKIAARRERKKRRRAMDALSALREERAG